MLICRIYMSHVSPRCPQGINKLVSYFLHSHKYIFQVCTLSKAFTVCHVTIMLITSCYVATHSVCTRTAGVFSGCVTRESVSYGGGI